MEQSCSGFVWHVRDILSGRRSHWNSTCVPVLSTALREAEKLESPFKRVFELLLASVWTAFRADFSQGAFQRWQKSIDADATKKLLGIYLAYLLQVSSIRGLWADLKIVEEKVWIQAVALFPEVGRVRLELCSLDSNGLARELSALHLRLLSIVASDKVDIELLSSPDFFKLRYYHPTLLSNLSDKIGSGLSNTLN